mmetsp:Transcript_27427/g.69785  ORF Transcript_27427/g.69785 Transcript_27427/m.69785 type:complete len:169 (-) Transcript_27427:413-919(-)
MGLQEEYAVIAEGMRNGTLKPAAQQAPLDTWVNRRFSSSYKAGNGCERLGLAPGFGEQYDAAIRSSVAYSFGNCSRNDSKNVYISKEISQTKDVTPAPLAYTIPTSIGPRGTARTVSTRAPTFVFGSDPLDELHRQTGELRELKSSGVDMTKELASLRARIHPPMLRS